MSGSNYTMEHLIGQTNAEYTTSECVFTGLKVTFETSKANDCAAIGSDQLSTRDTKTT